MGGLLVLIVTGYLVHVVKIWYEALIHGALTYFAYKPQVA
jgi:hypothetical protein